MASQIVNEPIESMITSDGPASSDAEVGSIGAELARAYKAGAEFYMRHLGLSPTEADARVRGIDMTPEQAARDLDFIRTSPLDTLTWTDLQRVMDRDADAVITVWNDLRVDAREELESGHRMAQALDWPQGPWQRAQFLALRESFRGGMRPRSGIDSALIDLAAEAYSDYLEHTEHWHRMMSAEAEVERHDLERTGKWSTPRRIVAETIADAERRKDAAHKRFLQTVKMLHELQRSAPSLYVARADQINVGQQQVNMSACAAEPRGDGQDLPE